MQRFLPGLTRLVVLISVYFVVAAASFNGFYDKWSFRDGAQRYSVADIIDGTAHRPFVYRQLVPAAAGALEAAMPAKLKDSLINRYAMTLIESSIAKDPRYTIRYYAMYYLTFLFLFAALFVLRQVCLEAGYSDPVATAAAAIFVLFIPILQTTGGYFYDFSELFFMSAAVLLGMQGRLLALGPLVALATWNKESFLLFLVSLYPFLRLHWSRKISAVSVGAYVAIAGGVYLAVRTAYSANPGNTVEGYFVQNLLFYANPINLFARERNYGLWTLTGYSVFTLVPAAVVAMQGWRGLALPIRHHIVLAAVINFPLLMLFCAPGEMRNLSMLFVGFVLVTAQSLSQWVYTSANGLGPPKSRQIV